MDKYLTTREVLNRECECGHVYASHMEHTVKDGSKDGCTICRCQLFTSAHQANKIPRRINGQT